MTEPVKFPTEGTRGWYLLTFKSDRKALNGVKTVYYWNGHGFTTNQADHPSQTTTYRSTPATSAKSSSSTNEATVPNHHIPLAPPSH